MVLWIALFASVLLAIALGTVRTDALVTRTMDQRFKARLAAEGALNKVAFQLATAPRQRSANILPATEVIGDWQVTIELSPEMQKTDINLASEADLSAAFQLVGIEPDLADSLAAETLDWRDTDDLARVNGAEKRDYVGVTNKPPPANRAFTSVDEVAGLRSMTEGMLACISPSLTIIGGRQAKTHAVKGNKSYAPGDRLTLLLTATPTDMPKTTPYQVTSVFRLTGRRDNPYHIVTFIEGSRTVPLVNAQCKLADKPISKRGGIEEVQVQIADTLTF